MPTAFSFEHTFRAPSTADVFAAYFDPDQLQLQDRALDIADRQVLELADRGDTLRRVCKVVPRRQLPALLRPFTSSLHYLETATWRRSADEIDVEIRSSISRSDKPTIRAVYRLSRLSSGEIRRRYDGTVSVDIALVSARIERGIVAEFERSMPIAAACTQAWLDRSMSRLSARA
ncbi:MAG TPA: DUF2505 family protein [Kofleriaceae bacterium]|nr:DUF2505 family protein [Kofleriaceae bacterium]